MESNKELNERIQELQIHEKNLQNFVIEKQNIQIEFNAVNNALEEVKISGDEVYKILDNLMVRANKEDLKKELESKKKILEIRLSSIEKQEKIIEDKVTKLRSDINTQIASKKK